MVGHSRFRALRSPFAAGFGGLGLLVLVASGSACGSRGPLDLGPGVYTTEDAAADVSADAASDGNDASDASADTAPPRDSATVDAPAEASLIDCGSCVATTCGQDIVQCLTDTACRGVLTCVAQTCLAGGGGGGAGGLDPSCLLTCANGDTSAIASLIGIFTCVTQKCGSDCGGVLGGLGGLGGGGFPGGGGGKIRIPHDAPQNAAPNTPENAPQNAPQNAPEAASEHPTRGERIFSAYPEIFSGR